MLPLPKVRESATAARPEPGWPSGDTVPAQALDALPLQAWLLDAGANLIYANPLLLAFAGQDLAGLSAQGWTSLLHADDQATFVARWLDASRGDAFEMDYRLRAADGNYHWHHAAARRLAQHPKTWLGTHHDISPRMRAEADLREADALWQLALESIGDGVWDWQVQSGVERLSPRILEMYGFSADEIAPDPAALDGRTHPDDVPQMQRDREAHFNGLTPSYSNEHRVLCKDGSWKWILSRGMVISRDAEGRPLRMVGTHTDITQRKADELLIWQQAHFDALTGLPNRRMLRQELEQDLKRCAEQGRALGVLFIDLDHFKEVNDTLGHGMGDELLVQAAGRIRQCVGEADRVARMGGDEFTVVLTGLESSAEAERVAQRIIATLADAFQLQDERVFVSASVGISQFPAHGERIEELFKHADQALYAAKGAGRNRWCHFMPALQEAVQTRMRLSNDLREALPNGALSLVYQPIVEIASRRICKAEALLRWQHPERGAIAPDLFIPMAESSGLIVEIGNWVFGQAVQQLLRWRRELCPEMQISINKSPVQFRQRLANNGGRAGQSCLDWAQTLAASGLPGNALVVEITEGLLLEADTAVTARLQELRAAGLQISLDDFGTGYSSLSYLQQHDIDIIKIDKSFVRELHAGSKNLALCKAIILMAHELGMKVVAEGVETDEQHGLLLAAGCDYGQGYLYARPMAPADFEALLRSRKT